MAVENDPARSGPANDGQANGDLPKASRRSAIGFAQLQDGRGIWLWVKTQETPGEHQNRWQVDVHPPQMEP